jgi:hypothetical protein
LRKYGAVQTLENDGTMVTNQSYTHEQFLQSRSYGSVVLPVSTGLSGKPVAKMHSKSLSRRCLMTCRPDASSHILTGKPEPANENRPSIRNATFPRKSVDAQSPKPQQFRGVVYLRQDHLESTG